MSSCWTLRSESSTISPEPPAGIARRFQRPAARSAKEGGGAMRAKPLAAIAGRQS